MFHAYKTVGFGILAGILCVGSIPLDVQAGPQSISAVHTDSMKGPDTIKAEQRLVSSAVAGMCVGLCWYAYSTICPRADNCFRDYAYVMLSGVLSVYMGNQTGNYWVFKAR